MYKIPIYSPIRYLDNLTPDTVTEKKKILKEIPQYLVFLVLHLMLFQIEFNIRSLTSYFEHIYDNCIWAVNFII